MTNPISKQVARLVRAIRDADSATCEEAAAELKVFRDSWLEEGNNQNLAGAGDCCLSDTDTTEAVRECLEIHAENKKLGEE